MTDQTNNIERELREAEAFETALSRVLSSIQPPAGAVERLLATLAELPFHESELTLDGGEPYSFEKALRAQEFEGSDLLAAGLEEEPIDEDELDPDDEE